MQHGDSKLPEKFRPRVPVVGCVKIGEVESSGGKARPKKLDHFRLCGASPTASGVYPDHPAMADMNKAKLRELTVELVSDDPKINLEVVYAMAGRGSILCRGTGTEAERRLDPKGTMSGDSPFQKLPEGSCGENCSFFKAAACKLASTLRFRIPGHTGLGETWQFRTTSWNSASDLLGAQLAILELTGGVLARIPLQIRMTEQRRQALTSTGRTSSNFWTLGISFAGQEEDLIQAVKRARSLKAEMAALALPTVEDRLRTQVPEILENLSATEERAIAAEFYPNNGATVLPEAEAGGEAQSGQEASIKAGLEREAAGTAATPQEQPAPAPATPATGHQEGVEPIPASPAPAPAQAQPLEAAPEAPQPAVPAPAPSPAPEPITNSQRILLRKHGLKLPGVDINALDAKLGRPVAEGGLTKRQASDLITKVLKDPVQAFKECGGVLAA